jgi:SAM-dependent methyltransferase
MTNNHPSIPEVLQRIAREYPAELSGGQLQDVLRIAFNISLVTDRVGTKVRIADLGGGIGLFSVGCAALGMDSVLVDDFKDDINAQFGDSPLAVHRKHGVKIVTKNVIEEPLGFESESFDVITTFDSMEHWHNSPKDLFHEVMRVLKPAGLFVLSGPNCVSIRKRITVPLGIGDWSEMKYWYEEKRFRGHVREPDVQDLHYIARDMGLERVEIIGRNWLGYHSRFGLVRKLTPLVDKPLCLFPSLCADIYLVGFKPGKR